MSEFFIRRPIVAMVISIFTIILGVLILKGVPISQYPSITPPMINSLAVDLAGQPGGKELSERLNELYNELFT